MPAILPFHDAHAMPYGLFLFFPSRYSFFTQPKLAMQSPFFTDPSVFFSPNFNKCEALPPFMLVSFISCPEQRGFRNYL